MSTAGEEGDGEVRVPVWKCFRCGIVDEEVDPAFGACRNILECEERVGFHLRSDAFRAGAAVAFGLVGMAEAIRAR